MEIQDLPINKKVILFDGICNLCNSWVQFVIEKDKKNQFVFASLQSEIGQKILIHTGIDKMNIDSLVYYNPGVEYQYKSNAAIQILKDLGGLASLSYGFIILPRFFRDKIYDFIAANRYKWYGKQDSCWIPTPELKSKFLE